MDIIITRTQNYQIYFLGGIITVLTLYGKSILATENH